MTTRKQRNTLFLDLTNARFPLGQLVCTPCVESNIPLPEVVSALDRHLAGDWGEVGKEDRAENEFSLREGFRLFSVYRTKAGVKFWIITEADRSVTTVLLPSEY